MTTKGQQAPPKARTMAPPSAALRPQDPVLESLRNAPVDDEPVTAEERAAIDEARAELRAGAPTIALEDFCSLDESWDPDSGDEWYWYS